MKNESYKKKIPPIRQDFLFGAADRDRTGTLFRARDFKLCKSLGGWRS